MWARCGAAAGANAAVGRQHPLVKPTARIAVRTLALGMAGGALFALSGLPLPWLLGALVFNLAASFSGLRLGLDPVVRGPALAVLGVAIGASLTPDLLSRAQEWWVSLVAMAVYVAMTSSVAILYCHRVMGFDRTTAVFAGMPGGLNEMIFTGAALGGDLRRIALAHAGRLAVILMLIAPAMKFVAGVELGSARPGFSSWTWLPARDAQVLLGCAVLGTLTARLLRLPNPFLLGPLAFSAGAHVAGLTTAAPPNWLLDVVQLTIGSYVGSQFAGTRAGELVRTLLYSTVLTLGLLLLAGLFAWLLSRGAGPDLSTILLAFVPGGIAEMCLIAVLLDADPIFVAAHHMFRVLLIMMASPVLAWRIRARNAGSESAPEKRER
jgi:membrane AbrB-like protein